MKRVHGLVALCAIGSYDATISSSDTEEAADVHGDVWKGALVYGVVHRVNDTYTKSISTYGLDF